MKRRLKTHSELDASHCGQQCLAALQLMACKSTYLLHIY